MKTVSERPEGTTPSLTFASIQAKWASRPQRVQSLDQPVKSWLAYHKTVVSVMRQLKAWRAVYPAHAHYRTLCDEVLRETHTLSEALWPSDKKTPLLRMTRVHYDGQWVQVPLAWKRALYRPLPWWSSLWYTLTAWFGREAWDVRLNPTVLASLSAPELQCVLSLPWPDALGQNVQGDDEAVRCVRLTGQHTLLEWGLAQLDAWMDATESLYRAGHMSLMAIEGCRSDYTVARTRLKVLSVAVEHQRQQYAGTSSALVAFLQDETGDNIEAAAFEQYKLASDTHALSLQEKTDTSDERVDEAEDKPVQEEKAPCASDPVPLLKTFPETVYADWQRLAQGLCAGEPNVIRAACATLAAYRVAQHADSVRVDVSAVKQCLLPLIKAYDSMDIHQVRGYVNHRPLLEALHTECMQWGLWSGDAHLYSVCHELSYGMINLLDTAINPSLFDDLWSGMIRDMRHCCTESVGLDEVATETVKNEVIPSCQVPV